MALAHLTRGAHHDLMHDHWPPLTVAVVGGEAYISFKPGVVDSNAIITDESTRGFLKAFIDQFTTFVARLSFAQEAAA